MPKTINIKKWVVLLTCYDESSKKNQNKDTNRLSVSVTEFVITRA